MLGFLRPFGWISHTGKAKSGYLSRTGLIRVLAWPYLFKNYSVRDLAEFLEIYGLPLRVGKYPDGADPYVLGESTNTAQTYGYDSVTQMQETKATLCKIWTA